MFIMLSSQDHNVKSFRYAFKFSMSIWHYQNLSMLKRSSINYCLSHLNSSKNRKEKYFKWKSNQQDHVIYCRATLKLFMLSTSHFAPEGVSRHTALLKQRHFLACAGLHFGVVWACGTSAIARNKLATPRKSNHLPFLPHPSSRNKTSSVWAAHILLPVPTARLRVRSGFSLHVRWFSFDIVL